MIPVIDIWEATAVALALGYLVLAIRESVWCWPTGMASTAIYLALFFDARLYAESALQVFYLAVSAYGWWHWARPAAPLPITRWRTSQHLQALALVALLAGINGALLARYTGAALPWLDALVSWGSVVATWMVARKVLENWLWWFVVDALGIGIYVARGLWLTAALFAVYLVMIGCGYATWRRRWREQPA